MRACSVRGKREASKLAVIQSRGREQRERREEGEGTNLGMKVDSNRRKEGEGLKRV